MRKFADFDEELDILFLKWASTYIYIYYIYVYIYIYHISISTSLCISTSTSISISISISYPGTHGIYAQFLSPCQGTVTASSTSTWTSSTRCWAATLDLKPSKFTMKNEGKYGFLLWKPRIYLWKVGETWNLPRVLKDFTGETKDLYPLAIKHGWEILDKFRSLGKFL